LFQTLVDQVTHDARRKGHVARSAAREDANAEILTHVADGAERLGLTLTRLALQESQETRGAALGGQPSQPLMDPSNQEAHFPLGHAGRTGGKAGASSVLKQDSHMKRFRAALKAIGFG
jgi:hypothetical protein